MGTNGLGMKRPGNETSGYPNFSNPGKVEMPYSHSRSDLFFLYQTYKWLIAFYPILYPHTDSPEEKLNLVVNKAIK